MNPENIIILEAVRRLMNLRTELESDELYTLGITESINELLEMMEEYK